MFLATLIILLIVYSLWRFGTRNFGYWKKKGVKHEKPVFLFGNMYKQFMLQLSTSQLISEWYKRFPAEKYIGVHLANDLGLVLRDPELIKRVLLTDFKYFHRRGINSHKHVREPLFMNLVMADGDAWKLVRQRITPAFSSGKLKAMFPLIKRTAERMLSVTEEGTQDVKELMARYTTDFIGACGFGLDFNSLSDASSQFRYLGKRTFQFTIRDSLVRILKRMAPELFKNLKYFSSDIENITIDVVKQILKDRNYMPSGRNDFIDLLLEVKQKGKIVGESIECFNSDGTAKTVELEMDDTLIASQVFAFFSAGFETSSSATSLLLHELAFHPEVQERCHKEIDEILSRHNGKITYEIVMKMEYLEMAFKEALRLYPSPGFLMRQCETQYTFPGTTLTIDENVYVLIPLQALHKDPRFFEDPEDFRPNRHHTAKMNGLMKYVNMPFGEGPRGCIGARLGLLQSLAGVIALLSRFRVEPVPTSRRRPHFDPRSFFTENILGGLPLKLVRRQPVYQNGCSSSRGTAVND